MDSNWKSALQDLQHFVSVTPSIEITANCVAIPGDVRTEFYRLFDRARTLFIADSFPSELALGGELSRAFQQASGALQKTLSLEAIELPAGLNWFLQNPSDGLMRLLFDPLFDLLRGKYDAAAFASAAGEIVRDAFRRFFHEGYQKWGLLALMQAAAPDGLWEVPASDYIQDPATSGGDLAPGDRLEDVPAPVESKKLVFTQNLYCSFLVPKAIIHSSRLSLYMGLRPDFYETRWSANAHSRERHWLDIQSIYAEYGRSGLWPDLALYLDDNGTPDLALVSDYHRVARPDLIVEFMEEQDWYQQGKLETVKRHSRILQPVLGSFVACREAPPSEALEDVGPSPAPSAESPQDSEGLNIHLLPVGYEPAGFEPLFEAIAHRHASPAP